MAGYSRQDTNNNIATGNVINAEDFDNEYNQLEAAFNESTGHKHDGTAGEGAPIEKVGPSQDLIVTASKVEAKNTNTLDIGSSTVRFKDAFFDGTIDTDGLTVNEASTLTGDVTASANLSVGGNLTVTGDATINGNLTFGDADTDTVAFGADITSSLLPDGTTQDLGSATKQWRDLYIDGTANIDSLVSDTADINGGTLDNVVIGGGTANAITGTTITATTGFTGNVTGTVSSISNHTTDDLSEAETNPTNLWFTNIRAQNAITVTDAGGDGSLSYTAGAITYTGPSATETQAHFSAANSSGGGYGSLAYADGQFTFTKVTDANIRGRFSGGTGISIDANGVISGDNADTTNKGIASFATNDFSVTSGAVSLKAERIQDIVGDMVTDNTETGLSVTYQDADGTLDFALTADPTITLNGDVTGSGTLTNLGDVTITTTVAANSVALGTDTTGNYVAGVTGGTGVSVADSGSEGAAVTVSIGQDVGTTDDVTFNAITASSDVTVTGNLTVSGTTTSVNSTEVNIGDNIIVLNSGEDGVPSQSAGIEIERGTSTNKQLLWDEGNDRWTIGDNTFVATTFIGNLTGNASGNAGTATKLATARSFSLTGNVTASGVNFDGSGNLQLTTTIADNSVALGTKTTGNYMVGVTGGNAINVTHTASEGSTATIDHADTSSQTDVTNTGNSFIQSVEVDDYGHVTSLSSGSVTVGDATINITAGSGLITGGSFTTNASTNKTITLSHADTSSQASVDNSNGNVIQDVTLDGFGHITGLTSVNLDDRYFTETESDARFAAIAGSSSQNFAANTLTATTVTGTTVNATTVDLGDWTISEDASNNLLFKIGATTYMKLDSSGNLTVRGNITAFDTSI